MRNLKCNKRAIKGIHKITYVSGVPNISTYVAYCFYLYYYYAFPTKITVYKRVTFFGKRGRGIQFRRTVALQYWGILKEKNTQRINRPC